MPNETRPNLMDRLSRWFWNKLMGIQPLADLDCPCPVCGLTDGWHEVKL